MLRKFLIIWLTLTLWISWTYSQDSTYVSEFGFRSDNDSYLGYGQDKYYTNGLFINYRRAINQYKPVKKIAKKIWEAEIGQYMFNPYTGNITDPSRIDRPFAAYLYVAAKLNWYFKSEQVLQSTLQIGTIGSAAKGKETQEFLHRAVGFYEIEGWEYQIKDEIGLNAILDYTALLLRSAKQQTDLSFSSYLQAGNTFAGLGAGLLFRTGNVNPLWQSASTNSRISAQQSTAPDKKELFFFARPLLHFIAYDATVQGGLFAKDKGPYTFQPRKFVLSQQLGIAHATSRWTVDFSVTFKTKEIKSAAKAHQYGSFSVYYRFN